MYGLRFDLRAPGGVETMPALYDAAIGMAEYTESRGAVFCGISEHHASPDGYLPAPLLLASAMAARTTTMQFMIAAALLPLYDPIKLAEEMTVLDILSHGRVSYVLAIGYRPEEYALFGVDWDERGAIAEEKLELLLHAVSGEPFQHDGRTVQLTPGPVSPGGIRISWGGGTKVAARRAARHGLDFLAETDGDDLREAYETEARLHGRQPGACMLAAPGSASTVFVAHDVDRAWDELGPSLMHDVLTYGEWNVGKSGIASISSARTVEELRAEQGSHRIYGFDKAVEIVRGGGMLPLHPLCGGLPPELAWKYLEIVADEVIPAARASDG
jgi:alkanesulfonate monooxygenase SsuD/methylene tetrahydromethanopterin reductase-like flavin-dependent oxidoreductase (luciferase family)